MKRKLIQLTTMFAVLLFAACGGKKQMPTNAGDVALADEPCQAYALEKPAQRAAGVGLHFQEATARNLAELNARAQLARTLQTCIETATKNFGTGTTLFSADDTAGASVSDQAGNTNDREFGFAKELIKGAVVVKTTRYKTPNNQYRIYVCVEYNTDVPQMAAKVANAFNEKLTPKQQEQVKFEEHLFKQEMEKAMKEYKGATAQ